MELSEKQVHELNEHLSFKSMRSNKSVNYEELGNEVKKLVNADATDENLNFIRKGESGGWKNVFANDVLGRLHCGRTNTYLEKIYTNITIFRITVSDYSDAIYPNTLTIFQKSSRSGMGVIWWGGISTSILGLKLEL